MIACVLLDRLLLHFGAVLDGQREFATILLEELHPT